MIFAPSVVTMEVYVFYVFLILDRIYRINKMGPGEGLMLSLRVPGGVSGRRLGIWNWEFGIGN